MRGCFSGSISRIALLACLALSASACVSAIPVPDTTDGVWSQSRWPESTVASLSRGRALYVNKCSGCHSLYVPSTIAASRWPAMIEEMTRRANLHPDERDLILRYVITAGRSGPAGAAHSVVSSSGR
ncbi:MAG: hypothetical protein WCJ30_11500 [Deltaproteobacteria bacterium]